jgi:hemoglobin
VIEAIGPIHPILRYHHGMSENQTLYEIIGGEARLRELVDRFYDLMELEPEFAGIHAMHPKPNDSSREKLFMFLSGWMGGPDLFIERYGHPRLRARHLPFAIGTSERDQWLRAMAWALCLGDGRHRNGRRPAPAPDAVLLPDGRLDAQQGGLR